MIMTDTPQETHMAVTAKIEQDVKQFLAAGGVIQIVPTHFCEQSRTPWRDRSKRGYKARLKTPTKQQTQPEAVQ